MQVGESKGMVGWCCCRGFGVKFEEVGAGEPKSWLLFAVVFE